ncbi:MAG: hypothetical protein ACPGTU_13885, partial [Myxococcota bacterium]
LTVQGRAGSGTISNIHFEGSGAGSSAVQVSVDVTDFRIAGVYAAGCDHIGLLESGSAGVISGSKETF